MELKLSLILDMNYILNKLVFILHKENILFGQLEEEMVKLINQHSNNYSYENIYMVHDSKHPSWRKSILPEYKANRTKNSEIDWTFVFETFNVVLDSYRNNKRFTILGADSIEGDDFISYTIRESNKKNTSCLIISSDKDLLQFVYFDRKNMTVNLMNNDASKQKIYIPSDIGSFFTIADKNQPIPDLFNFPLSDYVHDYIKNYISYKELTEVNHIKSLFCKLVSGDKSDNISSIYIKKNRGIGDTGAAKIYDLYVAEYGIPIIHDSIVNNTELFENISDIVCEYKKLPNTEFSPIIKVLQRNFKLICLYELPVNVEEKIVESLNLKSFA